MRRRLAVSVSAAAVRAGSSASSDRWERLSAGVPVVHLVGRPQLGDGPATSGGGLSERRPAVREYGRPYRAGTYRRSCAIAGPVKVRSATVSSRPPMTGITGRSRQAGPNRTPSPHRPSRPEGFYVQNRRYAINLGAFGDLEKFGNPLRPCPVACACPFPQERPIPNPPPSVALSGRRLADRKRLTRQAAPIRETADLFHIGGTTGL